MAMTCWELGIEVPPKRNILAIGIAQDRHGNVGHNYVGTKAEGLRGGSHYVKLRFQKPSRGFK
jgi:hypothetical protein